MTLISVIIPIGIGETAWKTLLPDLNALPNECEIICVTSRDQDIPTEDTYTALTHKKITWLTSNKGRAVQMNAGARVATGQYLWFLHADTICAENTISQLMDKIKSKPNALLFFDLTFLKDGNRAMPINAFGAFIRSRFLKVPFGDQGFCLTRDLCLALGGYDETAPYGEGHLLVWRAHQNYIPVTPVKATLYTSARKYKNNGWWKTTLSYQYLWIKQALPEAMKLLKGHGKIKGRKS